MATRRQLGPPGLTLVELLTSLAILALILGLLLPAIQAARQQSRKSICMNNLRQIGVAAHHHSDSKRELPRFPTVLNLLPFLEQETLFRTLTDLDPSNDSNASPAVVLCPDDNPLDGYQLYCNYLVNDGGSIFPRDGLLNDHQKHLTFRQVTDGLTQTMFFSERLTSPRIQPTIFASGIDAARKHPLRVAWTVRNSFFPGGREREFADYITSATTREIAIPGGGISSSLTDHSVYDHIAVPGSWPFMNMDDLSLGTLPGSSGHGGGVHAVRCDSSTDFYSLDIDSAVWRSLGTRDKSD